MAGVRAEDKPWCGAERVGRGRRRLPGPHGPAPFVLHLHVPGRARVRGPRRAGGIDGDLLPGRRRRCGLRRGVRDTGGDAHRKAPWEEVCRRHRRIGQRAVDHPHNRPRVLPRPILGRGGDRGGRRRDPRHSRAHIFHVSAGGEEHRRRGGGGGPIVRRDRHDAWRQTAPGVLQGPPADHQIIRHRGLHPRIHEEPRRDGRDHRDKHGHEHRSVLHRRPRKRQGIPGGRDVFHHPHRRLLRADVRREDAHAREG